MLDISVSYNKYAFLGNEFLTWLWYVIENDPDLLTGFNEQAVTLEIGNRITLENIRNESSVETITIKGDNSGLEEAKISLKKGSVVTELILVCRINDLQWTFNLKGESFNLSGFKHPETAPMEKKEDLEGVILEKIFLYEQIINYIDHLYIIFIKKRISDEWNSKCLKSIINWIIKC
jgi:hypothetical protein